MNYNIVCDGPSAPLVRSEDLLPGTTVAVNCAISLSLPIDIWATVDPPDKLWEWSEPHRPEGLELFTTDNNLKAWHGLFDVSRIYSIEPPYLTSEDGTPTMHPDGRRTVMPTVFCVLIWLYRMREGLDVERVRILGADMRGTSSPLHPWCPYEEAEEPGQAWRWKAERGGLAQAMRLFRAVGIPTRRARPSLVVEEVVASL